MLKIMKSLWSLIAVNCQSVHLETTGLREYFPHGNLPAVSRDLKANLFERIMNQISLNILFLRCKSFQRSFDLKENSGAWVRFNLQENRKLDDLHLVKVRGIMYFRWNPTVGVNSLG